MQIHVTQTQQQVVAMAKVLADRAKDKNTSRTIAYRCREASKALSDLFAAEVMEAQAGNGPTTAEAVTAAQGAPGTGDVQS